jgi:hypothetical protein
MTFSAVAADIRLCDRRCRRLGICKDPVIVAGTEDGVIFSVWRFSSPGVVFRTTTFSEAERFLRWPGGTVSLSRASRIAFGVQAGSSAIDCPVDARLTEVVLSG